jgi:hypothetical protein
MATKTVRIGSLDNIHQYDDGDFDGGIETDDTIIVGQAPVNPTDVLRLSDVPTLTSLVTASAVITDHSVVRGDGGARGIQDSLVTIDDTGQIELLTTARVKKEFTIPLSDFNPGASGPTPALQGIFPSQEFTINDDMHTAFEVPSDCDTSVDLTIEIYWGINEAYATNNAEVQWQVIWRAIAVGESVTAGGSSGTIDFGDVNIPAAVNLLAKTEGIIAAASISQDDLIAINLSRIALDGGNNPAVEPYVIMVNLEYTANKLGEAI